MVTLRSHTPTFPKTWADAPADLPALVARWQAVTLELGTALATLLGESSSLNKAEGAPIRLLREGKALSHVEGTLKKPNVLLRHARNMRYWSQADLADELSNICRPGEMSPRGIISAGMVSGWERGVHTPGPFWRKKLCQLFATTPDQLGLLEVV